MTAGPPPEGDGEGPADTAEPGSPPPWPEPASPELTVAGSLTVLDAGLLHLTAAKPNRRSDIAGVEETLGLVLAAVADALADLGSRLSHLAGPGGPPPDDLDRPGPLGAGGGATARDLEIAAMSAVRPVVEALAGAVAQLDRIEAALGDGPSPGTDGPPAAPLPAAPPPDGEWEPAAGQDAAVDSGAWSEPGGQVEARGRTAAEARLRALDLLGVDDGDATVEVSRHSAALPGRRFVAQAWVRRPS